MRGEKMEQMKKAQIQILSEMRETDYFSIIIFDDQIELWSNMSQANSCEGQPLRATQKNLEKANSYIKTLEPRGYTNIHGALMKGIEIADAMTKDDDTDKCAEKIPWNVKPLIIFLTDGKPSVGVTNINEILTSIRAANRDINVPILSLGFGRDVDFPCLKKISLQNHGFARKIYEGSDASLQIRNFYREVSSLLLTDVKFRYVSIGAADISDLTETKFSQYFGGTDNVVAGKLDTTDFCGAGSDSSLENLEKILKANVTGGGGGDGAMKWLDIPAHLVSPDHCGQPNPWNAELATPDDRFLEALWAYLTIRQLLDNEVALLIKVNETSEGKGKALELALKYGFVTPLTSLLVVTPESERNQSEIVTDDDADYRPPINKLNYHHPTSFAGTVRCHNSKKGAIFILFFTVRLIYTVCQ